MPVSDLLGSELTLSGEASVPACCSRLNRPFKAATTCLVMTALWTIAQCDLCDEMIAAAVEMIFR